MNNLLRMTTELSETSETNKFIRPSGVLPTNKEQSAAEKFATKATNSPELSELMDSAGLNWEIETKPLYTPEGIKVPNRAIIRKDTGDFLGVVGSKYTPVQNKEAFGFFNDFLNSGSIKLASAGSINKGKRVFVQAEILNTETSISGNDSVKSFLTIGKAHDGSMALNIGFTPIRMFCANQLNVVTKAAESKMLKFRHTPKIHENIEQVAAILNLAKKDFEATVEQYRYLSTQTVNSAAELEEYIKIVFAGDNYKALELEGKSPSRQIITNVFNLFENGRGANKTQNTYWKAYNAINEYLNHERGSSDQKRFDSISFGDSKTVDLRALQVAMRLTA